MADRSPDGADAARPAEAARRSDEARPAEATRRSDEARPAEATRRSDEARPANATHRSDEARPAEKTRRSDGARRPPAAGEVLRVNARLAIPVSEILLRTSRSSGPGGQHANVTASRVEAVFDVASSPSLSDAQRRRLLARAGERVVAVAQDERSQTRNRRLALERLAERLAAALIVPRARRATKPTKASRERRLQDKRRDAQRKRERRPPERGD